MAIYRPSKPKATLPNDFGGVQTPYTSAQIRSGYQDGVPQVVDGGNMNYERKGLFQGMKYLRTVVDFIRDTPIGKIFWINSSGQMDYMTPAVIATDSEYNTGTATDRAPNVKQVVDNLALKADDNSVVHKNRDEIIRSDITFTEFTHYKTDIAYTETPSVNKYGGFNFIDKHDSEISAFYAALYKDGKGLAGFNLKNKSGNTAILCLRYNTNGVFYTEAPTPTEDTNTSTQIDTVGARNTKLAKYLPLSGGTMAGNLTITRNAPSVFLRNTEITKGTAPSATKLTPLTFSDKDGKLMGVVRHQYDTNKNSIIELLAFKTNANSDTEKASLTITYPASGNPYAKAPASAENGSILTTVNKSKSQNGYFKLGNGLIIQWGKTPNISNSGTVCTLPTPFTTANYSVTAITSATFNENSIGLIGKTTTNFTLVEKGYNGGAHNVPNYFIAIGY